MEKVNLAGVEIGKRIGLTAEEQAQLDKEAAEWKQTQYWLLHPQSWIYHRIFEAGEYKLYQDCSLAKSPYGKQIKEHLEKGSGLYLWGGVGVGKTYLALSSLKWQLERKQIGYIWTVSELLDRIRYFIGMKDAQSLEKAVDNYARIPMLILDDFGVQVTTAWADEQLYEVINRRWLKRDSLITIVTSNCAPGELEAKAKNEIVGARIVSRLLGMCKVLHIEGKDRRLTK